MPSSKPELDVWDSCCLIGILNSEADKLPALLAQTRVFETGATLLGVPIASMSEIVTLNDGSPAEEKLKAFMDNPYVLPLQTNLEVTYTANSLRYKFDTKRMPALKDQAIAAGVPQDKASKLTIKDAEILATALVYKADRLTTYDPFLLFLGEHYITPETGLIISEPISPFLPFPDQV